MLEPTLQAAPLTRRRVTLLSIAAVLPIASAAACGGDAPAAASPTMAPTKPATAPTAAPAAPTTAPAAPTTAPAAPTTAPAAPTTAPAAPAAPTVAAAAPTTSAPANPTPATAAAPGAAGGGALVFTIDRAKSVATFRVNEQLVGKDLPNDAVGTSKAVSGTIALDATGKVNAGVSKISVDMNAFSTDSSMRDNYIKRSTLEVAKFPTAEFLPTGADGLPSPIPVTGEASFKLTGSMSIHGVTKPVTWNVTAKRDGKALSGKATTTVTFGDFGMTPPKVGAVVSVKDEIRLEIDLVATSA
ncbi:MAG: YceI family protein [Chloroflexi bacterium]|nr:YceI family protein [Chloroflexota bacterium]